MAFTIIRKDNRFRLETPDISLDWLADTRANRKAAVVFLRLLSDNRGYPLFTHKQLAQIVKSSNRQASSRHLEAFFQCGGDFQDFLCHKRKVDAPVVSAVLAELKLSPLSATSDLKRSVHARLDRRDLSQANINVALEIISAKQIRPAMQRQLAFGRAHYKETYLLEEMMTSFSPQAGQTAQIASGAPGGMVISDPTALRTLVTPGAKLREIPSPLKWLSFLMVLYYHGVPLSVLGNWFSVHKTTVLRWIMGVTLMLWPLVSAFLVGSVKGTIVYIDEKWLKIQGRWYYWFVVLDEKTGLPVVTQLLASRSRWACRWIGKKLR